MILILHGLLLILSNLSFGLSKSTLESILGNDVQVGEFNAEFLNSLSPDEIAALMRLHGENIPEYHSIVIDPEAYMTVEEIIKYHGYPVTSYQVQTEDGYILTIQRIPHGKNGTGSQPRKAVLIQHGVFCSSASWVVNVPDKNLPYLLADAGYDVWLGNIRGTLFGRNHTKISPNRKEFWEFSYDEMAKYDLPAIIDFILKTTGEQQLDYIGHSMGSTMVFALLSTQLKYNEIIKTVYAMAPLARAQGMRSPIRYLVPFRDQIHWWMTFFSNGEVFGNTQLVKLLSKYLCTSDNLNMLCTNIFFITCGYNEAQFNATRLPVFLHHTPAGTSLQALMHLAQSTASSKFQWYDFGDKKNKKVYGQPTPPEYLLENVKSKVVLFWGENDLLTSSTDVSWLGDKLVNLAFKHRITDKNFSHVDFLWAIDVKTLVYDKLIEMMTKV